MEWTELSKLKEGVSFYDHVISETPLGRMIIEWKSWKEQPVYDVRTENKCIGIENDLDSAKEIGKNYLINLSKNLTEFLKEQPTTATPHLVMSRSAKGKGGSSF